MINIEKIEEIIATVTEEHPKITNTLINRKEMYFASLMTVGELQYNNILLELNNSLLQQILEKLNEKTSSNDTHI